MEEVQLENLLDWLDSRLGKKLDSFKRDGQKTCGRIEQLVNDLKDAFQRLGDKEEKGASELAVKSANRFVEKSLSVFENFAVPHEVTYGNLEILKNDLERTLRSVGEYGQRWVPKMAPWYKSEIAEIDIYLKKLGNEFKDLQKILGKKYPNMKDYESISNTIDEIRAEQEILNDLLEQKKELSKNLKEFEEAKREKHSELEELKEATLVRNVTDVEKELQLVEKAILKELRTLEKPFRKLDKLVGDEVVRISGEHRHTLRRYLDDPLASFLSEDDNCSQIKSLLTRLNEILNEQKLDLKGSRRKKAIEQINRICNENVLPPLKRKYLELAAERDTLKKRIKERGLTQKQKHLETAVEELNQKKEDINTAISRVEADYQKSKNRINNHIQKLEQKVDKLTGTHIKIII